MAAQQHGWFGRLALAVMRNPRATLVAVLLVTVLGVLGATRLTVDANLVRLMPDDDPTTQAIERLDEEEAGVNLLTIAVAGDDPARLDSWMRSLAAELEAMPEVGYVLYDLDPELTWRIGTLSLSVEDLTTLRDRLKSALALGPGAANPFVASRLLDLGPLTEKLKATESASPLASDTGTARLLVRPTGSSHDMEFSRAFMAKVNDTLARADAPGHGLHIAWVGGPYRHSVEDVEGIIHDLKWTISASLVLVVVLVGAAFRDPRAVLLVFVPLIIGNVWTLGYAWLTVGTLTTFTSFTTAVLIGLGVDFSIHLYSRYREERAAGGELQEAVARAWDRAGPPSATAAVTSAGGLLALWVAQFKGFQQLGTLLAGGVLLCLVSVMVVLPLLIQWRERQPRAVPLRLINPRASSRPPTYRLAPLALIIVLLCTVASALLIPRIEFENDISELRTKGMAYADLDPTERQLAQDSYAPVVVTYPDDAALAADHVRLSEAMASGHLDLVGHLLDIHSVIPIDQDARVALLQELADLARNPNLVYLPAQVQLNLRKIADSNPRAMTADDLPESLRHLLGASAGNHRILIIPKGNMWDLQETARLHEQLDEFLEPGTFAGQYLAMSALYRMVKQDAPRVAVVALVVVFLLVLVDLRHLPRALGTVGALLVGMTLAGAAMALFRIKLSMVNFVGIPILMGIGVDVIVHLLHRLRDEGPGRVQIALTTTGWAAGLSALTTVVSFASLSFASNQGIRSLGLLIVLGLSMVTVAGLVVVPLGWMTAWKLRGELPRDMVPPGGDNGGGSAGNAR